MNILIVDDEPSVCTLLKEMLETIGHCVEVASSGEAGLAKFKASQPSIVLLDLNLPDLDGLTVLKRLRSIDNSAQTILISGSMSVDDAVEAMKHGARHCLTKPFNLRDLERCILEISNGVIINKEVKTNGLPHCPMVVASKAMKHVTNILLKVSKSPASTVLIMGETGTGKEVVAKHLHHLSERREKNFVAVNCAAIPESLIDSELFGHERGAFTDAKGHKKGLFEEADGGTLFLDEVGELPLQLQAKLLRALQERVIRRVGATRDISIDVRVIAATNVDLAKAAKNGRFREDLFFRLMVIPLQVPPLRERKEDILPLVEFFIREFSKEFKRPCLQLTGEDKEALTGYSWPGNVRELRNCVERSILLDLGTIRPYTTTTFETTPKEEPASQANPGKLTLALEDLSIENVERTLILEVMSRVHGNKNQAANLLGINRTTLYRKLTGYGIDCEEDYVSAERADAMK